MKKINQKGITLVALVITIIVLLILAGVAISLITGGEGLFGKTKQAAEKYNNAAKNEALSVNELLKNIDNAILDKLPPKDFNAVAIDIKKTSFTINASTEDSQATEHSKMSGIKEYIYYIKKETDSDYVSEVVTGDSKIYTNMESGTAYNVYVKAVDNAGNTTSTPVISITTLQDLIFTRDYLQTGSIYGNVTYTTGNFNTSDGIRIIGRSSQAPTSGKLNIPFQIKWYKDIDLTNYSKLTFYAKKVVNHGSVFIIIDNLNRDIIQDTDSAVVFGVSYGNLSSSWSKYEIPIENYNGVYKVIFIGGYLDNTGNTSSQSEYCDIKLIAND